MAAVGISETLARITQTTGYHIPEDGGWQVCWSLHVVYLYEIEREQGRTEWDAYFRVSNYERYPRGTDPILPAVLEFREETEEAFLHAVVTDLDPAAPHFKLAPTYTLYLVARYRASTHYRPELTPTERAHRLTVLLARVAAIIHNVIQVCCWKEVTKVLHCCYFFSSWLLIVSRVTFQVLFQACFDKVQGGTKKWERLKNPTKIEEIQEKKKLLTEIEPLRLAF